MDFLKEIWNEVALHFETKVQKGEKFEAWNHISFSVWILVFT